jgi:hypothetical protein
MEHLSPSPKLVGNWLIGVGPTFIFPTASSDYTGQGKYQVGPSTIVGYFAKNGFSPPLSRIGFPLRVTASGKTPTR